MITDASRIRYCLEKAVFIAQHGRPGPVLLDIPMNIQRAQIDPASLESFFESEEHLSYPNFKLPCSKEAIQQTIELLVQSERPMILAGGGVRAAHAAEDYRKLLKYAIYRLCAP